MYFTISEVWVYKWHLQQYILPNNLKSIMIHSR